MRQTRLLAVLFLILNEFCAGQQSVGRPSNAPAHDSTVVVYDDYIGQCAPRHNSLLPKIYVESFVRSEGEGYLPSPIVDVSSIADSISYPDLALRAGLEGKVWLRGKIDSTGALQDLVCTKSDAEIFIRPALDGVHRARFRPVDSPSEVSIRVSFRYIHRRNPTIRAIVVDRTECYGFAGRPSFKITLHPDGVVLYEGHAEVDKIGMWSGQLPQRCLSSIVSLLYFSKFFSTAENIRSNSTDGCFITISVTTEYRTKSVRTDCYEPIWAIGDYVERVVNDLTMEKKQ